MTSLHKRAKTKYFLQVADSLAFYGPQSRASLTSSADISLSTLSRVLEVSLDFGAICEKFDARSSVFSLEPDKRILLITLNEAKLTMNLCRLDGTVICTHSAKTDMRYFYNENVSLFLRECSSFIRKKKIKPLGIYIINDPLKSSHKEVYSDTILLSLCTSYFDETKIHISGSMELTARASKLLVRSETPSLTLTGKDGVLYAMCSTNVDETEFVMLRSIQTGSILRSDDTSAASVAFAVANIISLLKIKDVLFDSVYPFNCPYFVDEFKKALSAFLGYDISEEGLNVIVWKESLALTGAVTEFRHEFIENLLKTQKGMLEYDILSY